MTRLDDLSRKVRVGYGLWIESQQDAIEHRWNMGQLVIQDGATPQRIAVIVEATNQSTRDVEGMVTLASTYPTKEDARNAVARLAATIPFETWAAECMDLAKRHSTAEDAVAAHRRGEGDDPLDLWPLLRKRLAADLAP